MSFETVYSDSIGVTVKHVTDGAPAGHSYIVQTGSRSVQIDFQRGAVKESGINGISTEALLVIVIHRLNVLNGKLPSPHNAEAIHHANLALDFLNARTRLRQHYGVEGTSQDVPPESIDNPVGFISPPLGELVTDAMYPPDAVPVSASMLGSADLQRALDAERGTATDGEGPELTIGTDGSPEVKTDDKAVDGSAADEASATA